MRKHDLQLIVKLSWPMTDGVHLVTIICVSNKRTYFYLSHSALLNSFTILFRSNYFVPPKEILLPLCCSASLLTVILAICTSVCHASTFFSHLRLLFGHLFLTWSNFRHNNFCSQYVHSEGISESRLQACLQESDDNGVLSFWKV